MPHSFKDFQSVGQFFTEKNVFVHLAFKKWWSMIPSKDKKQVLEPFAGKNGIVEMLKQIDCISDKVQYHSYDILPGHKDVLKLDTLKEFPQGYNVGVTNPPFLAKNSATRNNIEIQIEPYSDLYELCLKRCLDNLDYLAVIIPESFITSSHFKNRLYSVVSLTEKRIFKSTEQPVCLALFIKEETNNFLLYRNNEFLGTFKELIKKDLNFTKVIDTEYQVIFHQLQGQVGFIATDATSSLKKMKMVKGDMIPDSEVNNLARLRLRILILKNDKPIKVGPLFIKKFNNFLDKYRNETGDIFLTSFKGLRDDGFYRRRMSFSKLKVLVLNFLSHN
jgi:hypothetical protein